MRRALCLLGIAFGLGLAACAATTNPGAIGVSRQQLMLVSDEKINREAAEGFSRLSDDEIAAIMGHEIAHALREHSREKVSQQQFTGLVAQGASLAGARLFMHLPFSRAMESEADAMGLELMARAGYDPRAASNVWRKMMQANASRPAEFFSTHPDPENRIQALDAAVPRVMPLYEARRRG